MWCNDVNQKLTLIWLKATTLSCIMAAWVLGLRPASFIISSTRSKQVSTICRDPQTPASLSRARG